MTRTLVSHLSPKRNTPTYTHIYIKIHRIHDACEQHVGLDLDRDRFGFYVWVAICIFGLCLGLTMHAATNNYMSRYKDVFSYKTQIKSA